MTDPIADMLTRIRNGVKARKSVVELPSSKMKVEICKILKDEGYIMNFKETDDGKQGILTIELKYGINGKSAIDGLERVSKPGRRIYKGYNELKPVLDGLGMAILSTNKGIMTDKRARELKVGGEVLLKVW